MKIANRTLSAISLLALAAFVPAARAQDWPQWRGPDRDARAAGFTAPKTWPKELTQKWKVTVGDGVATPSLVGDKLYVFSREGGSEILRCLSTADGKELWQEKYDALGASGPAGSFSGPRSSPTVAEGKVVTFGLRGVLSCHDAATGKLLWRKDDFPGALPRFFTSASPIVASGLCVAQVGGDGKGGVIAYDLTTGDEKWRWTGDSPAYGSPVLMTVGDVRLVVAPTETKILALALADGKLAWETPFAVQGRGYNASTPVVSGQTLIYSGSNRGTTAIRLEKEGEGYAAKPLWKNDAISVQFASPVLKQEHLYGLTGSNDLYCLNATDGKTVWTAPVAPGGQGAQPGPGGDNPERRRGGGPGSGAQPAPGAENPAPRADAAPAPGTPPVPGAENPQRPPGAAPAPGGQPVAEGDNPQRRRRAPDASPGGPGGGPGGGRGMRGGGGRGGYGTIVDAGQVLLALTPASQLVVFAPGGSAYTEIARIKVSDTPTQAYPVLSGNRIFIKDQDTVTLYTLE